MPAYVWILEDASGTRLRDSEPFESQAAAEDWMGRSWAELLEEGAERVVLSHEGRTLYRMGLRPE